MQAVILAAGRGVRMKPLTETTPKPLLTTGGRHLLDYTFDALPDEVDEVIMVIGYLGEQIQAYLGQNFRGRKIKYVVQEKLEGTAKALWEAKPFLKGKFLVLMADDIYAKGDLEKCLKYEQAILVLTNPVAGPGGRIILNEKGELQDVKEEKDVPKGALVAIGAYLLSDTIFQYKPVKLTDRAGEWGLPQTIAEMARDCAVAVVEATRWIKITAPEDLSAAESALRRCP